MEVAILVVLALLLIGVIFLLIRKQAPTGGDTAEVARTQAVAQSLQQQLDASFVERARLQEQNATLLKENTQLAERERVANETRELALQQTGQYEVRIKGLEEAHRAALGVKETLVLELEHSKKLLADKVIENQRLLDAGQNLRTEYHQLLAAQSELKGNYEGLSKQMQERSDDIAKARGELQEQFRVSMNELMEVKARALKEDNKESVTELLLPVREKLLEFSTRVEDLNKQSAEQHGSLKSELSQIQLLNQALTQEAHNLSQALRGDAKVMGDWGEHTLELVLESSGLQKGIHYTTQEVLRGEEGVVRTDITLHMPQGRNVVIDSKVSIKSYVDYCSAAEPDRPQAARALLTSLDAHIKKLATTEYHRIKEGSVEFTFMFVPQDPVFSLAVQLDPELVSKAYKQRVMLVTPSTLLVALKVVSDLWQREEITKSHKELVALAANIYHKLTDGLGALEDVGKQIGKAREAYDTAFNLIVDGKGNVIRSAENIRKIASRDVKQTKRLDKNAPSFYQQGLLNAEYEDTMLELSELPDSESEDAEL